MDTPHASSSSKAAIVIVGMGVAALLAGAIVGFSSVQADARPSMVTKAHPCGSCHPPNRPPKK